MYIKTEAPDKAWVADGRWHHVLGVCNNNTWQVWIDGVLAAETIDLYHEQIDINSADPFTIGYYHKGTGEGDHAYYEGKIDNVRVYHRVLSEHEIEYLHLDYL